MKLLELIRGMELQNNWGLLGPETLPSSRRTRTLGVAASVRRFNELAVPGLGGVWYAKQLLFPLLGIAIAQVARNEGAKVNNIEMANSIEALACWLAFKSNRWGSDPRLRGRTKLGKGADLTFSNVRKRSFYVTQPMRMATVQTLPALGFVETENPRFNSFSLAQAGATFVELVCKNSLHKNLVEWVRNSADIWKTTRGQVLSPLLPLDADAREFLRDRLKIGGTIESQGDKIRRRNALAWMESIQRSNLPKSNWDTKPESIDETHWHDLVAGAKFFKVRDAAIQVLDALEAHIGNQTKVKAYSLEQPSPIDARLLLELNNAANAFLDTENVDKDAVLFCRECASPDFAQVLRFLVTRDGQVLKLIAEEIKPGPAFRGFNLGVDEVNEESDTPNSDDIPLPDGISYRMRNLYLLNLDLNDELDTSFKAAAIGEAT